MLYGDKILTKEQLQVIKDFEWAYRLDGTKDYIKWANYNQMAEVPEGLWATLFKYIHVICFDAVNLIFEIHSSTSGMYGHWEVSVSPSCTVYMERALKHRGGSGGTFSSALADFTLKCLELYEEVNKKEKGESNETVQLPAQEAGEVSSSILADS